jgi:hypothetical protein
MPPRSFVWAIVVFWLATAGWLFYREFVPRFRANQPPRFYKYDYADEVRNAPLRWFVYKDKRALGAPIKEMEDRIGSGTTQLQRAARAFRVISDFDLPKLELVDPKLVRVVGGNFQIKVKRIKEMFQVGLEEELQEQAALVVMEINESKGTKSIIFYQEGKVEGDSFDSKLQILKVKTGGKIEEQVLNARLPLRALPGPDVLTIPLPSVPVSPRQSFLNPMHPLDKVPDLWESQHWQMPLSDPLGDAIKSLGSWNDIRMRSLFADVTAQTLHRGDHPEECLVIDYRDPSEDHKLVARTWVRKSDHLVLRQEAAYEGTRLVMDRGLISK